MASHNRSTKLHKPAGLIEPRAEELAEVDLWAHQMAKASLSFVKSAFGANLKEKVALCATEGGLVRDPSHHFWYSSAWSSVNASQ